LNSKEAPRCRKFPPETPATCKPDVKIHRRKRKKKAVPSGKRGAKGEKGKIEKKKKKHTARKREPIPRKKTLIRGRGKK